MRLAPRVRLSDHIAETRVLRDGVPASGDKLVLSLGELMVRDGRIRNPLGFYNEIIRQPAARVSLHPSDNPSPGSSFRIFQVCSSAVRRLTAAMGLSKRGFSFEEDLVGIVVLLASPAKSAIACSALLNHTHRLLQHPNRREQLLACKRSEEIVDRILEFER